MTSTALLLLLATALLLASPAVAADADPAPLTITRSTAEPVSPANAADDLLTEGQPPWRVTAGVASVVFRLGPDRPLLTAATIDAGGLADTPRAVEVMLGSSEQGPWRSVASFALEPGDGPRRETLAPSREAFAMLRMSGHQSGQGTMALKRFTLFRRAP